MDNIGLDLHKRESQLCILTEEGAIQERRILTDPDRFTAVLGGRSPARILVEASTESEWVARHLESLGHMVIVADPNYAPMYATRRRRVKTGRRDARTLAEALRVRGELAVRDALVHTRVRFIGVVKALVRREGLRIAGGAAEQLARKLAALPLSPSLEAELAPLLALLEPLNAQIAAADARLAQRAAGDPVIARLTTAPTIGPVTAVAFVATLDDVGRFESAPRVAAYLGLAPSERSSGEQQRRGRISKTGNPRLRSLLVEAAWRILRTTQPGAAGLRAWAEQIAARRGRSVAAVALARRLAGILYAMWRDGRDYRGLRLAGTA